MKRRQESTWMEAVCKKMNGLRSYVVVSGGLTCDELKLSTAVHWCHNQISILLRNHQLSPYNQCYKQTPHHHLLWNLPLNMCKLRLLLLLQGMVVLSNDQSVFRSLRLRLYTLLETLFWTLLLYEEKSVKICLILFSCIRWKIISRRSIDQQSTCAEKVVSCYLCYLPCHYLTRCSSCPLAHRAATKHLYNCLSASNFWIELHLWPKSPVSVSSVCHQVFLSLFR